jgi:hypothetical protein
MLRPTLDVPVNVGFREFIAEDPDDLLDAGLAGLAGLLQVAGDAPVRFGLEVTEGEVFHLPLEVPDAEPVRQGGEDFAGLDRDPFSQFGVPVPGPLQAVELVRQPHEHQAHIRDDREQHLAQRLRLRGREGRAGTPVLREPEGTEAQQFLDAAAHRDRPNCFSIRSGAIAPDSARG